MNRNKAKNNNKNNHNEHSKHVDLIAKILCVFAAFCLWVYVMSVESPEHEQTFSHIVVELVNTEELISNQDMAIYNGYGTMIDVTLSGKKSVLSKLTEKDIVATADVSNIKEGGNRYNCKISVDVPAGCSLVGMSQDTISVYLDKASQISVDLTEIRDNTKLPEGCYTGLIDFPVDKITVVGPTMVLNRVSKAVVLIDLTGVTKSERMTREIYLADKNGVKIDSPYIDFYPKEITFDVPVIKTETVDIDVYFKHGFLNFENTEVNVSPAYVEITGDPEIINRGGLIDSIEIDEKTEFSGMRYEKVFKLRVPDGVSISADEVTVTARIDSSIRTRDITVPGNNIRDTGSKGGVKYTLDKSPVIVTIMGEVDILSKIDPNDITLELDMSPYSQSNTGTIKVRAKVVIDSEYKNEIIEVGSYNIDVTFLN